MPWLYKGKEIISRKTPVAARIMRVIKKISRNLAHVVKDLKGDFIGLLLDLVRLLSTCP